MYQDLVLWAWLEISQVLIHTLSPVLFFRLSTVKHTAKAPAVVLKDTPSIPVFFYMGVPLRGSRYQGIRDPSLYTVARIRRHF